MAITVTTQTAYTTESRRWKDVELQMSSPKGILLRKPGSALKQFREIETRNGLILFPNNSQNCHKETQRGAPTPQPIVMETTIFFFPQKQLHKQKFVREERTNELYATVLHCGYLQLYVPLVFENNIAWDNLVD